MTLKADIKNTLLEKIVGRIKDIEKVVIDLHSQDQDIHSNIRKINENIKKNRSIQKTTTFIEYKEPKDYSDELYRLDQNIQAIYNLIGNIKDYDDKKITYDLMKLSERVDALKDLSFVPITEQKTPIYLNEIAIRDRNLYGLFSDGTEKEIGVLPVMEKTQTIIKKETVENPFNADQYISSSRLLKNITQKDDKIILEYTNGETDSIKTPEKVIEKTEKVIEVPVVKENPFDASKFLSNSRLLKNITQKDDKIILEYTNGETDSIKTPEKVIEVPVVKENPFDASSIEKEMQILETKISNLELMSNLLNEHKEPKTGLKDIHVETDKMIIESFDGKQKEIKLPEKIIEKTEIIKERPSTKGLLDLKKEFENFKKMINTRISQIAYSYGGGGGGDFVGGDLRKYLGVKKKTSVINNGILTINCREGNTFEIVLDQNITQLVFVDWPPIDVSQRISLYFVQDSVGSRNVQNWGGAKFSNGIAPQLTTTPNAVDLVIFDSFDGGVTIYGNIAGVNYQ